MDVNKMTTKYIHVKAEDRCAGCPFFHDGCDEYSTRCNIDEEEIPSLSGTYAFEPTNCPLERYDSVVIYLDSE
jgi:hypothetical protein